MINRDNKGMSAGQGEACTTPELAHRVSTPAVRWVAAVHRQRHEGAFLQRYVPGCSALQRLSRRSLFHACTTYPTESVFGVFADLLYGFGQIIGSEATKVRKVS